MVDKEYKCISVSPYFSMNFTVGKIYKSKNNRITDDGGYLCEKEIGIDKINEYYNPRNIFELLDQEITIQLW